MKQLVVKKKTKLLIENTSENGFMHYKYFIIIKKNIFQPKYLTA